MQAVQITSVRRLEGGSYHLRLSDGSGMKTNVLEFDYLADHLAHTGLALLVPSSRNHPPTEAEWTKHIDAMTRRADRAGRARSWARRLLRKD